MKMSEKLKYKIYIDTSSRENRKVSLVRVLKEQEEQIDEEKGEINIIISIKKILDRNNLKINDINEFVPNLGPGSFTGLKMGVTVANILNWSLGIKSLKNLQVPEYGQEPHITKSKEIKL